MSIESKSEQTMNLPTKVGGAPTMPSMGIQPPFTNELFLTYSPSRRMQKVFEQFSRKVMLPNDLKVQELVYGIYHGCLKSQLQTAEILGLHFITLRYQMNKMGIEFRSRSEALVNAWAQGIFANIYTPEANAKRSISMTQAWRKKDSLLEGAKKARATKKANRDRKAAEILGGSPEEVLAGYVRQGLSSSEIAQLTGQTESVISSWRIIYQVGHAFQKGRKNSGENMATVYQTALDNGTFQTLPEKYRHILIMRAGGVFRPRTLVEVGNEFGITRQRVRQIEEKIKHRVTVVADSQEENKSRKSQVDEILEHLGPHAKTIVERLINSWGMTTEDLALEWGCSHTTAHTVRTRLDIKVKPGRKALKKVAIF